MTPDRGIIVVEWTHPRHGEILETVCQRHESELLSALTTLGIGCGGSPDRLGRHCVRCATNGVRPREWLASCKLTADDEVA